MQEEDVPSRGIRPRRRELLPIHPGFVAWFGQEFVTLGPTLDGPRLDAVGTLAHTVAGDGLEFLFRPAAQRRAVLAARLAHHPCDALQRTGEADRPRGTLVSHRRRGHGLADQIVGQAMRQISLRIRWGKVPRRSSRFIVTLRLRRSSSAFQRCR